MPDDDEFWEEDPPVDALPGGVSTAGGTGPDDLLLDIIAAVARLHVLLAESSEEEFERSAGRVEMLRGLIRGLPTKAGQSRRLGFKIN